MMCNCKYKYIFIIIQFEGETGLFSIQSTHFRTKTKLSLTWTFLNLIFWPLKKLLFLKHFPYKQHLFILSTYLMLSKYIKHKVISGTSWFDEAHAITHYRTAAIDCNNTIILCTVYSIANTTAKLRNWATFDPAAAGKSWRRGLLTQSLSM